MDTLPRSLGKPLEITLKRTIENTIKHAQKEKLELPFSIYSSIHEQNLLNVPIAKPLLIVVFNGEKVLGKQGELLCRADSFIFLADSPAINMRNIPIEKEYFALLIEFDEQDYSGLQVNTSHKNHYCIGMTTTLLEQCLQQFVESSLWAPKKIGSLRKREILELLCHMGHEEILTMLGNSQVSQRLHTLFNQQGFHELALESICEQLAMSESTLRRKLKSEGTSVQEIKDQAKLGLGLHLLQTSHFPISAIAQQCGYQSPSRFTERFKQRFGLTPSELRKTKMEE
ncbi:MAG: helix-turn-helix transcriptional regulator [Oleispira sp.]